ncbi:macrophage migration inhibitory factor-like [Diadema antillarum]|uniref:macrophage migration inhibitory factor-like n=1 Tax=Diadema antillarum TaxID=105358 RepID=UPI003A86DA20
MPILQVFTNVKDADIPQDWSCNLSSELAKQLGKPEKFVCISVVPNQTIMFGGSSDPCAMVNVTSIGKLGLEENKNLTKVITAAMAKMNVAADRMYVLFRDIARQDVGWNNTTFAS